MFFKKIPQILPSKKIVENLSYVSILEIFVLLAPLITYPYLVRVIGKELYGFVILAQVLTSYASIIIDFGSNKVCAKHVSINRDNKEKLSEIISSVLIVRFILWFICFFIYICIVILIQDYKELFILFLITYFLTLNDVLFPQFFFLGLEKLKITSILNIIIKSFFIITIFFVVKSKDDYLYIPLLYALGYAIAGISSLYIIFKIMHIKFCIPCCETIYVYVKDSLPIFFTNLLVTIKGKLSYLLIGSFVSVSNVVIYDLAYKLNNVIGKPTQVISVVLFPQFAKERNVIKFKKATAFTFISITILVIILNIFLEEIVHFFINEKIDLFPIRLLSLAPIYHSVGMMISQNLFVAFGYNKYLLNSIIISISAYVIVLVYYLVAGIKFSLYSFIIMDLLFYSIDLIYRLIKAKQIIKVLKS